MCKTHDINHLPQCGIHAFSVLRRCCAIRALKTASNLSEIPLFRRRQLPRNLLRSCTCTSLYYSLHFPSCGIWYTDDIQFYRYVVTTRREEAAFFLHHPRPTKKHTDAFFFINLFRFFFFVFLLRSNSSFSLLQVCGFSSVLFNLLRNYYVSSSEIVAFLFNDDAVYNAKRIR